jgi:hypothetical protein
VAEICECSESHVKATWEKYKKGGIVAIRAKKIGRKTDTGKLDNTNSRLKPVVWSGPES